MKICHIAKELGLSASALYHLIQRGRTLEEAIEYLQNKPIPAVLVGSKYKRIKDLADDVGLPYGVIKHRLYTGWPIEACGLPIGTNIKHKGKEFYVDYTGKRIGLLTVIKMLPGLQVEWGRATWLCRCDCGNFVARSSHYLSFSGRQEHASCGCVTKKILDERNYKHGLSKTRLYHIYHKMIDRCYNDNNQDYKYYGGRGIKICPEWLNDFVYFYTWANANGYEDNLTIERIDGDKGYSPENCCWITIVEQQHNKHPKGFLKRKQFSLL